MVFKKKSSLYKIVAILFTIVIVSIIHFYSSNYFEKKNKLAYNSVKLIERNNILLKEILISANRLQTSKYEIKKDQLSNLISLYDYSLSLLITGGRSSNFEVNFIISPPDDKTKKDLISLERYWSEFRTEINNLINGESINYEFSFNLIENISLLIQNKQNDLISAYRYKQDNYSVFNKILNIISIIIYFILVILLFLFVKNTFLKPVNSIENVIDDLTEGKTTTEITSFEENEFTDVFSKLNKLNYKINEISEFVNHLVKDNYEIKFKDYNKQNILELSLVKLRDKLKENIELNKKQQKEEQLRQWSADGQAKFNDILRESSSGMKTLTEASLINLVKFFNAAQGGFFILNDDVQPPVLELTSAFAYDRIKALTKTINLGDGIIGMCALEKNTVWLNNVPEGYMEIESGLGEAPPSNILIVPVKTEDSLLGIIEIASFNKFNNNEVKFIENIAENIASTLETTKISDRTSGLLEETQKKSDELAMRDSEMSEKIVELREAQKETRRSETEMSGLITAVDKVLFKLELSIKGRILTANNLFLNKINFRPDELKIKNFIELVDELDKKEFDDIFNRIKNNESVQKNITLVSKQNSKIRVLSLFTAIKNDADQIVRILFLGDNISYREELEKKNETLVNELKYKTKVINEKEIELNESLNQLKNRSKESNVEIQKLIKKEELIKQKSESEIDKKYFNWIKDISK